MLALPFHVLIIGGGLGGLCLAQGLKKAGISVAVYERDRTPDDRLQGYRIHIEPQGNQALSACLPAELFDSYLATSGSAGKSYRISTDQLQELVFFGAPASPARFDPAKLSLSVSRITLRQVLLSGLEEVVHFGKRFAHYLETPDGKVTAFFEDGTSAVGDLLVGADGGKSRVRKQLLPLAETAETGVVAMMGKLALTEETRRLLIPGRFDGAMSILGPNGHAMFVAIHDAGDRSSLDTHPVGHNEDAILQLHPGLLFDNQSNYVFWALLARREKFGFQEHRQPGDGTALRKVALGMIEGWHPRLRQLVAESDPSTIICKPLRTSLPIKPWPTTRVTLLGDAIHSMPPTRGIGGNTALRDAHQLCQRLIAARSGQESLLQAIGGYERSMLGYGFAAVRGSMQALHMHVEESRLKTRLVLRSIKALSALRRPGANM